MARAPDMTPRGVNADRRLPALVNGARLRWRESPQPGVHRRLLERVGDEVALATSIVRYAPASRFEAHGHALGEEFMVLQGVFADEHGHYPEGTYVRNPPGTAHSPFSTAGCVIFVKLRQMHPGDQGRVVTPPESRAWQADGERWSEALLHASGTQTVRLARLAPGCTMPARQVSGGEEIFVLQGAVTLAPGPRQRQLARWGWFRRPGEVQPALASARGALLWIKRGHLSAASGRTPCTLSAISPCSNPSPA